MNAYYVRRNLWIVLVAIYNLWRLLLDEIKDGGCLFFACIQHAELQPMGTSDCTHVISSDGIDTNLVLKVIRFLHLQLTPKEY